MRQSAIALTFVLTALASVAFGGTLVNPDSSSTEIPIWTSKDAFYGCMDEMEETGKPGPICMSAIVAMVPPGTKARRIKGWLFFQIQILDGPYAGVIGYVQMEWYKP